MTSIGDSSAKLDITKIYSQHHVLISLIQERLDNPRKKTLDWLDIACGKGQLIYHLDKLLDDVSRGKIVYSAYDVNEEYIKLVERRIEDLKIKDFKKEIGDIGQFKKYYTNEKFDCISIITALHEFPPLLIPEIVYESLIRLKETGFLFVFDLETLVPNELGAITWNKIEIEKIIKTFLVSSGVTKYSPTVLPWSFQTTNGWHFVLQKNLDDFSKISKHKVKIIKDTKTEIIKLLNDKIVNHNALLEVICRCGSKTKEEQEAIITALYNYWTLAQVLEALK